jgi:hypothetical protein
MNTKLKFILAISLFGILTLPSIKAQDTVIHRNVTVERDYKPVIQDVGKINAGPNSMILKVEKAVPTYSDFNLPLAVEHNIHTLPAAEIQQEKFRELYQGLLRIGAGSHLNTLGDLSLPLLKGRDAKLDLNLNHLGTFTNKLHSFTKLGLDFEKEYDALTINAGVKGSHEYFKYYGDCYNKNGGLVDMSNLAKDHGYSIFTENIANTVNPNRTPWSWLQKDILGDSLNTFWRAEATASIVSNASADNLQYHVGAKYNYFNSLNSLTEHFINVGGGMSIPMDKNRLGVDFDYSNLMYKPNIANFSTFNFWDYYSIMGLNPYFRITGSTWDVRIGVKSSFAMTHGKSFSPSPDIKAEWQASPKYFAVYGGITGSYTINSMSEMMFENRYLFPDTRVEDTYTPIDLYAGVKVRPMEGLLLDAFIDYRKIENQYFFVNKSYQLVHSTTGIPQADSTIYSNRFDVVYSAASLLRAGLRVNYRYKNTFNVQLKTVHNQWNVASELYAWHKPEWESDLTSEFSLSKDFHVMASLLCESASHAKLGNLVMSLNPKVDLNLGATYSLSRYWSTFIKINNILNSHYEDLLGYHVQGINGLIGMTFNLQ